MQTTSKFVGRFKEEHTTFLQLIESFRAAIESSNGERAGEVLDKMSSLANGHLAFERTYLYPRLRRLILELTQRLNEEGQKCKEFIRDSKAALKRNRLNKDMASGLPKMLPRLARLFKDCDDLVFLVDKFGEEEKFDLEQRLKECYEAQNLISV